MKKISILFFTILLLGFTISTTTAATIDLYDWGFNIDGNVVDSLTISSGDGYFTPAAGDLIGLGGAIDVSGFDFSNGEGTGGGLGTINITVSSPGPHFVGVFFDHEVTETDNGYDNETGSTTGAPLSGQTWEMDEPGFVNGDIFGNFSSGLLDNGIGTSVWGGTTFPDDIAMAMAWDFLLGVDQTATISFLLSETAPTSGFYLAQFDSDSQAAIYFRSSLSIQGDGPPPIPEPATMLLLSTGLAGLVGLGRRRFRK